MRPLRIFVGTRWKPLSGKYELVEVVSRIGPRYVTTVDAAPSDDLGAVLALDPIPRVSASRNDRRIFGIAEYGSLTLWRSSRCST